MRQYEQHIISAQSPELYIDFDNTTLANIGTGGALLVTGTYSPTYTATNAGPTGHRGVDRHWGGATDGGATVKYFLSSGNFRTDNWTISLWLFTTALVNNSYTCLYNGDLAQPAMLVNIDANNNLTLGLCANGSSTVAYTTVSGITMNQWTLVTVRRTGSTIETFVNGVKKGTLTGSAYSLLGAVGTKPTVYQSLIYYVKDAGKHYQATSFMAKRALSDAEIMEQVTPTYGPAYVPYLYSGGVEQALTLEGAYINGQIVPVTFDTKVV